MTDAFDSFLKEALAPEPREADRVFVARIQAGIIWDQRVRTERAALKGALLRQIAAVLSLALALLWLARSPDLSSLAFDSPAVVLGAVLALFSLLVLVLSTGPQRPSRAFSTR